ncbi:MAG: AraC family transcriptional regulator [Bacillota bacterium]|nr:AraC family transcriptional regulator [Bacillota bacterium]
MEKQIMHYNNSNNFSLDHVLTESPYDIATHMHDCYELFYFISGELTYYIEGQAYKLCPNDLIITNSRELHRIVFNSKSSYERKYIHFKPDYIAPYQTDGYSLLNSMEKRKLGHYNRISAKDVIESGISRLWDNIEKTFQEHSPESQIMMKTYFIQMLVTINKVFLRYNNPLVDSHEYDKKVTAILDFINSNLEERITLDLLEQQFYVNKYYLCHIFKLNTGFTVIEYITHKRIMRSVELLMSGISALDVAHAVGFGDYSTFYKAFKNITGFSPRHYSKT